MWIHRERRRISTNVRRVARGVRRLMSEFSGTNLTFLRRTPHAALSVLLLVTACSPATTRPPFAPYPESLRAVIDRSPAEVTRQAGELLRADTVPVRFLSTKDAFLETAEFGGSYKIRLWADPDVPGKARVTVEAVYRPIEDPSRTARDLERAAPEGTIGREKAQRLLAALAEQLGQTKY
jgi:hypothetical protein